MAGVVSEAVSTEVGASGSQGAKQSLPAKLSWTAGFFGISLLLRFGSNIVLARLLAPEIFGVMLVVTSMRLGIELLSDVGIEQNIVSHKHGLSHKFFNTAWTIQILRGAFLSGLFFAISPLLARFYAIDVEVFLAIAIAPFVYGAASTSLFVMSKALAVRRRNLFDISVEAINFSSCVILALFTPTVWALVGGMLISTVSRTIISYFLDHPRHELMLDRTSAAEIWTFGRWFMILSIAMYASTNLDKLYLGWAAPFALVGIYGIARTISDLPSFLVRRLASQVVFPALAAARAADDVQAMADLRANRFKVVLLGAAGIGVGIAFADIAVGVIYDSRYAEAGWMLSLLLVGSWFSMMATLNEAYLLGSGRPAFNSATNVVRLIVLGIGLPLGYHLAAFPGAVCAVILSELSRYGLVGIGQNKIGMTFWRQDIAATALVAVLVVVCLLGRGVAGLGDPWALIHLAR